MVDPKVHAEHVSTLPLRVPTTSGSSMLFSVAVVVMMIGMVEGMADGKGASVEADRQHRENFMVIAFSFVFASLAAVVLVIGWPRGKPP